MWWRRWFRSFRCARLTWFTTLLSGVKAREPAWLETLISLRAKTTHTWSLRVLSLLRLNSASQSSSGSITPHGSWAFDQKWSSGWVRCVGLTLLRSSILQVPVMRALVLFQSNMKSSLGSSQPIPKHLLQKPCHSIAQFRFTATRQISWSLVGKACDL